MRGRMAVGGGRVWLVILGASVTGATGPSCRLEPVGLRAGEDAGRPGDASRVDSTPSPGASAAIGLRDASVDRPADSGADAADDGRAADASDGGRASQSGGAQGGEKNGTGGGPGGAGGGAGMGGRGAGGAAGSKPAPAGTVHDGGAGGKGRHDSNGDGSDGSDGGGGGGGGGGRMDGVGAGDAAVPGVGELKIAELLINPAGSDTGREWVEIVNRSTRWLDLSSLHVADELNEAPVDWSALLPDLPVLAPGQRAVLIQSTDPAKNGGIALGAAMLGGGFGTRVSLNNDADVFVICVGACQAGPAIDRFAWSAPPGPGYDGHALCLDDGGKSCPATQPYGDAGNFGSPGAASPPCP
jgi:hypothetical protein